MKRNGDMDMGLNCPSCGGKLFFDIGKQVLKCGYCSQEFSVEEYRQNNEGETQQVTYDTVVYTCRNCGAELTAPDEQTVAYCSYCGSEQMLSAKHEQLLRPKKIIPFKKTKREAKTQYAEALKGKLYVPKEFKDPQFLEGFRGIYLPYYSYSAMVPEKDIFLRGHAHYTKSGYDYDEDYDVYASLGGHSQDVNFDASAAFDDTLANEIAPFQAKDMTDFHEGYLAGLYADKATTSGATYIEAVEDLAIDSIYDEIEKQTPKVKVDRPGTKEMKKAELGITAIDCEVSLFPVWFLTWRNKKRVAYSVMNGQTGKMTTDIPVNKKLFFLISLAAAAVIFIILSILPIFLVPKTLCSIAAIILLISSILLHKELKRIYERESHIYDYGDTQHKAKKKKMKAQQAKGVVPSQKKSSNTSNQKSLRWIAWIAPCGYLLLWIIYAFINGFSFLHTFLSGKYAVVFALVLPAQLVFSIFTIINAVRVTRKTAIIPAIIAPLVLIGGLVVAAFNSPYDYWYYGTALACLVALILNALSAINYFNYLTTRPVPNFFRREGADNAK